MKTIAHRRALVAILFVIWWSSALTACAARVPGVSFEGSAAIRARQVVLAADGVLSVVEAVTDARIAAATARGDALEVAGAKRDAIAVIEQVRVIGVEARKLGELLRVVDDTRAEMALREGALTDLRVVVVGIQRAVSLAVVPIRDPGMRATVAAALDSVVVPLLDLLISRR